MLTIATYLMVLLAAMGLAEARPADQWPLATADTRVTIRVDQNQVHIVELGNPGSSHNWAGAGMTIPLMAHVWVSEQERATAWAFEHGRLDASAGTLTLAFTNKEPALLLRSIWPARPGHGPVEHRLEIENRSGRPVTLSHQDSLSLSGVHPGGPAAIWWIKRGAGNASKQGGTFTEPVTASLNLTLTSNCEDGASPVPWASVQVGDQRGLYVGWEFSGLGRIAVKLAAGPDEIAMDIGLNPDFKTDLEVGETFLVPAAFVGCYAGDVDEGSYGLHRFILEKLRPPVPTGYPDPSLNYAIYLDAGGPTTAKTADLLRVARLAHDLGSEMFMPDAMWFPACGDWRWDPARFPEGINPIAEYVHGAGMKMGLWCAWTNGGLSEQPDALSVRGPVGHADWFNADYRPDWKPGPFYGAQLCLACREAREWATRKTQWLVAQHHLDYLKHDCGPIVNHCNKTTHRHKYGVDVGYWATMGYYQVMEQLRQAHPEVVLENCSGAGHIKDFGVISRTHYTATTDTLSNLPDRQSFYDSTFALPPMVLQAYTYDLIYKARGDEPGPFFWRSAMMGAWQLAPAESAKWTDEQKDSARRAARTYKEWIRPMLKDVKVHHVLPRPDGTHWDGMFYWSPGLSRGTVYIFRPDAPEDEKTIKLKGLQAQIEYRVWCEDGSISPGPRTGKALMETGLAIRLPRRYSSDLIYVQDASLHEPAVSELKVTLPDGNVAIEFVRILAGSYTMGTPANEADREADELQHKVTLSRDFWMGKFEVTNAQFRRFRPEHVSGEKPDRPANADDHPVAWVTWGDAVAFCKWASEKTGKTIRLPTESEWEYASRAGSTTRYCFGSEPAQLKDYAWYSENSHNQTHPVGQLRPNAWGLYDVHGNVAEWCADWYGNYPRGDVVDPQGPSSGSQRVSREGSCSSRQYNCRSGDRDRLDPQYKGDAVGFRVVCSAPKD